MTPPARAARLLGFAVGATAVVALIVIVVVRDFAVATILGVIVSAVVLIASIVCVFLRRTDATALHDSWLFYNSQPTAVNVVLAILYSVMAAGAITLGIGFLVIGNVLGWGLVFCGAAGLVLLAFEFWVARRPFDHLEHE
jgi:hypothetical protein